jgi:hypothetical protein
MESQNPFLDNLFNGLSSVYNKDNGMLNSNMYTILNAYALVFQDIQRIISQTQANTYISTADPATLQNNFGVLIGFPKPPRLDSLTNGNEIYRAILRALYQDYQLAPTAISIQQAVAIILSFLVTDPTTADVYLERDVVSLNIPDTSIQLPYNPIPVVSEQFPDANVADPSSYIKFSPEGILTVTGYDPNTRTITFTGNPASAATYTVVYYRDDTTMRGTNWINLTNPTATNVLPLDLKTTENTFDNYKFSYWWNVYNRDGEGVRILQNLLVNQDQGLVWRLPEKTISFISPYNTSGNTFQQASVDLYNNQGQVYDINIVTPENPDSLIPTIPLDYFSQVAVNPENYLIRYSADNALYEPFAEFNGSFSGFQKNNYSIAFGSVNYGSLDFFEKGPNFDMNDLFGYGTKNIWLDVPFLQGSYTLNNSNFFNRQISLHESILFQDFFEEGTLDKWNVNPSGNGVIGEAILNPSEQKEDCLKLLSTVVGNTTTASAILPTDISVSGNHVEMDFLDVFNSGTSSYIDIFRLSGSNFNQFRFGIEADILNYYSGLNNGAPQVFVDTYFPNSGNIANTVHFNYAASGTTAPYVLSSGNPNTGYSEASLRSFTELTTLMSANLQPADISNADLLSFNFGWSGASTVDVGFRFIQQLDATTYGPKNITLTFSPSSSSLLYSTDTFVNGGSGIWIPISGSAGVSAIPVTSGNNTVEVFRGGYFKINGVDYAPAGSWDPSQAWATLLPGTGPLVAGPLSSFSLGDPTSFSVSEQASYNNIIEQHANTAFNYDAVVGLQNLSVSLNDIVHNVIAVYSGSTPATGEYPNSSVGPSGAGWNFIGGTFAFTNGTYLTLGDAAVAGAVPPSGVDYYVNYEGGLNSSSYSHFFLGNQGVSQQITVASGLFTQLPYFYQTTNLPNSIAAAPKHYLSTFPRSRQWHRVTVDFGTSALSGSSLYSGTTASIDQFEFLNNPNIGFVAQLSGVSVGHSTIFPNHEFSYFDNAKVSFYDKTATLSQYRVGELLANDWQGAILDQSTALEDRVFTQESIPNFHFLVSVLGWTDDLVFIVQQVVDKLKPAYSYASVLFEQQQNLDTISGTLLSNASTNWDSGNTMNNIIIKASGSYENLDTTESLAGYITVNPSGTSIF